MKLIDRNNRNTSHQIYEVSEPETETILYKNFFKDDVTFKIYVKYNEKSTEYTTPENFYGCVVIESDRWFIFYNNDSFESKLDFLRMHYSDLLRPEYL